MLRFQLFGFPVRVQWTFWLLVVLLSPGIGSSSPYAGMMILAWVAAAFISILWHELGHAFAFRRFGGYPEIVLYHFGGYAQSMGSLSRRESMIVSSSGPLFQLYLWAALIALLVVAAYIKNPESFDLNELLTFRGWIPWGLLATIGDSTPGFRFLQYFLSSMLWINLFWALLNMLPVYPLDGSHFLEAKTGNRRRMLRISTWTGAIVAVLALLSAQIFIMIMFGMLAYQSHMLSRGQSAFPWR